MAMKIVRKITRSRAAEDIPVPFKATNLKLMPTAQLNIVLPDTRVMAGEVLQAKVLVDSADPDTVLHSLTAEIRGVGRTGWVNVHTDKIFETQKDYLGVRIALCPPNTALPAGRHQFPLQVVLPDNLPSSYESQFGNIRYQIKVQMNANTEQATCSEVFPLIVVARSFFDEVPVNCLSPIDYADEVDFTCCSLPFGTITIKIALQRTAYRVGETVEATVRIKNRSRKGIKDCAVQLCMKTQFEAMSRYEHVNEKKLSEQIVEEAVLGAVKGRSTQEFEKCCVRIPDGAPPTHTYMTGGEANIIAIHYLLKVTAAPGIECEIPLVVTSQGYRDASKHTAFLAHNSRECTERRENRENRVTRNIVEGNPRGMRNNVDENERLMRNGNGMVLAHPGNGTVTRSVPQQGGAGGAVAAAYILNGCGGLGGGFGGGGGFC